MLLDCGCLIGVDCGLGLLVCYFPYVGFAIVVGFRFDGLFGLLQRFALLCCVLLFCVGISILVVLVVVR